MSNDAFSGETALVTGAASGIGRALAETLAREGAMVLCADIADLDATLRSISEAGGSAAALACDLSGRDGWKDLADAADAHGPVSIVVHSASPRRHESETVFAVTEDEWDAMTNTNLRSGFFLCRHFALKMQAAACEGRILIITSLHAGTPRNLPHYSASKAGQVMVVKELARAFGPSGIRVNGLAPGAIAGGGFKGDFDALSRKIALRRPGTAEDVALGALGILSQRTGRYISGTVLAVDGGMDTFNWIDPPDQ